MRETSGAISRPPRRTCLLRPKKPLADRHRQRISTLHSRTGKRTNGQGGRSSALLFIVSVTVGLLAVSASYVAFENIEHKVSFCYPDAPDPVPL